MSDNIADQAGQPEHERAGGVNRRELLQATAMGGLVLGTASLLAACGGSGNDAGTGSGAVAASAAAAPGGTPIKGGTMTVGMIGAGDAETIVPGLIGQLSDVARCEQLYDRLQVLGPDLKMKPALAESCEPNADATVWTYKLRDGVVWHDGKPFTADDVVYTIKSWSDPRYFAPAGLYTGLIDFKRVRKLDRLTVEVPLLRPFGQFPTLQGTAQGQSIIQNGASLEDQATRPVGTGPFKFKSFVPGQSSVFLRNPDYWESGKPYVDELIVDTTFRDEGARVNALLSGKIDALPSMSSVQARTYLKSSAIRVLRSRGYNLQYLSMRVDQGAVADQRIRKALQMVVDRQAIVNGAFAGLGTIGTDLGAPGTEFFASDLKPEHDIEQARALVKAAGVEGTAINLRTAPAVPGFVEAATLIAQQAKAAGFNIKVQVVEAAKFYTSAGGYRKDDFRSDSAAATYSSLSMWYRSVLAPGAPYDSTGWAAAKGNESQVKLLESALATHDPDKAKDLWHEVQQGQLANPPYVVYGSPDYVDGITNKVRGLRTSPVNTFNDCRFLDGWFAS